MATCTASFSSLTRISTTPLGTWKDIGPISSGVYIPSPPPSIIAGPPMATVVPSVAIITSQQATSAVLPANVRPLITVINGTRPLNLENWVNVWVSKATPGPIASSPGRPPPPSPKRIKGILNRLASSNIRSCL